MMVESRTSYQVRWKQTAGAGSGWKRTSSASTSSITRITTPTRGTSKWAMMRSLDHLHLCWTMTTWHLIQWHRLSFGIWSATGDSQYFQPAKRRWCVAGSRGVRCAIFVGARHGGEILAQLRVQVEGWRAVVVVCALPSSPTNTSVWMYFLALPARSLSLSLLCIFSL